MTMPYPDVVKPIMDGQELKGFAVWCPVCKKGHVFDSRWIFNMDMKRPTFEPSLVVDEPGKLVCHIFVVNGDLKYLPDSKHNMRNRTIRLLPFPKEK